MDSVRRPLLTVILVGVAIRLALAPITAHPADVLGWFRWTQLVAGGDFPPTYYPPYPLAYILWPFAALYNFLAGVYHVVPLPISAVPPALQLPPVWGVDLVPPPLFDLIIKLPFIISDVAVSLLIYEFVLGLGRDPAQALRASTLWFLNPITIWVSSGWGMFDSLPALSVMILLVLMQKDREFLAGIALTVAFALKLYPVLFVVPILFFRFQGKAVKQWLSPRLMFILGAAGSATLFYIPFASQALSYLGGAVASKNFFYVPGLPLGYGLTYWSLSSVSSEIGSIVGISTLAVILLQLVTYVTFLRHGLTGFPQLLVAMLASILALFLGFRFVGANFVVWIIPLMAMLVATGRLGARLFWGISFVAFSFSITDSFLPYYLLPLSPWIGKVLTSTVQVVQPYRIMASGTFHPGLSVGTLVISTMALIASALFALAYLRLAFPRASGTSHEQAL